MAVPVSSQSTFPLDHHFRGGRNAMRPLFDHVLNELAKDLDFELKVGKAYVGLLHTLVFAALHVQTKKVVVEFTSRTPVASPRITKSLRFQKSRWAYYVPVHEASEVDGELLGWLRDAYE